jgi:hypothetical protein
MNLTSLIPEGAAHAAKLPGDSVSSFLKMVADSTGFWATIARTAGREC